VAVDPPVSVRERLGEWGRAVAARARGDARGALRLLDEQSLHVTLCFLGGRPVGEIDALVDALGACAEHTCELSIAAPLWLPSRRPQTLAVEVHDRDGELVRLHERLTDALASVSSWQPERRRFRPHVTVARVRRGARRRGTSDAWGHPAGGGRAQEQPLPPTPRVSFAPEAIVLYRSWLAPEGASYEELASCELTPG
jgi:RNA 2',3'-cyclic 3'-phosphodiesterase